MYTRVTHTHTHIYTYIRTHVSNLPSARPYLHPRAPRKPVPARVRTRARIGGVAAHNRPRRIEARPSASAIVRAAGPKRRIPRPCSTQTRCSTRRCSR
jgi:hypothetical protein